MAIKAEMLPFNEMAPIMVSEARRHAVALTVASALAALIALAIGVFWPKNYVSSTTILAQKSDIIQPLLEGRAVPTGVSDRVNIAKQVIFSRKVLEDILKTGGWDALGMRGTCSNSYVLRAAGHADQVIPEPYADISPRTMVPVAHLTWSSLWLGIATDAVSRARAFVRKQEA